MYRIVESQDCTDETKITLYVNYIGIKVKNLKKQWCYNTLVMLKCLENENTC